MNAKSGCQKEELGEGEGEDTERKDSSNQKASFLSNIKTKAILSKIYSLCLAYTKTKVSDSLALKDRRTFAAGRTA